MKAGTPAVPVMRWPRVSRTSRAKRWPGCMASGAVPMWVKTLRVTGSMPGRNCRGITWPLGSVRRTVTSTGS